MPEDFYIGHAPRVNLLVLTREEWIITFLQNDLHLKGRVELDGFSYSESHDGLPS